jgi:TIR domain
MGGIPVGKRQFHAFVSHAHVDKGRADQLVDWLRDVTGVPIWYDADKVPTGGIIEEILDQAIEDSRSMICLLSEESVSRGWVQQEYRAAINHQTQHRAFRIIPVRLDDVSPPGFLQNYSNIALDGENIGRQAAAGILKGIYQPATSIDLINGRNTYVSRGWHLDDAKLAQVVCVALEDAGLQLIGDAEDQQSWVESRVAGIIEGCGAFAAILPYRPQSPHKTSKYVLREWELAAARDLPCLIIADPRVELPPDIVGRPGFVKSVENEAVDAESIAEAAAALAEDWMEPIRSPYVFYATDFDEERKPLRLAVKDLVEAITTLPCVLGEYVKGEPVQREILRTVAQAKVMLADITGNGPNVYVEVGAGRAADVDVRLLRQGPPGRPAFILRDMQVWDYSTDSDFLGRVTRITYPYRRTLLSERSL